MNKEIAWIKKFSKSAGHSFYRHELKLYDPNRPGGYLYVIQLGDTDHYKIGVSRDPVIRLNQLQTKCPIPLKILCLWFGHDYEFFEKALHFQFSHKRIKGEWFRLQPKDILQILQTYPNNQAVYPEEDLLLASYTNN